MKQTINLGAYGWLHPHWLNTFYPQDLPEDWRLGYYSNEFNTVLVPASYWQDLHVDVCEGWLDDVHPEFQFFIECNGSMFDMVSLADFTEAVQVLKPQLSGLVFLDEQQPETVKGQLVSLSDELGLDIFAADRTPETQRIWQPDSSPADETSGISPGARFAFIEDNLTDLRASRARIEPFTMGLNDDVDTIEATLIVRHPRLQASDLAKFRSLLEIMGH